MEYYFERYGDLELHRRMISDSRRTIAFARAIAEVVRPGSKVLDVGTGTGVLAMLAAKAGAEQVWAIDFAEIVQTAANLVKANGLSDKVKVLRGVAADLELDAKVDVLVSEWLGNFAFVESMLDDLVAARDKNLAEGGVMLPSSVSLFLAPIDDPVLYGSDGPGYWRRPVQGLDFSSLEATELKQARAVQLRLDPGALLSDGANLLTLDLATCQAADPFTNGEASVTVLRDGVLSGFCGWFSAQLSPGVNLDTTPWAPETHWAQTHMTWPPTVVKKGDVLDLRWRLERDALERRYVVLHLGWGEIERSFRLE